MRPSTSAIAGGTIAVAVFLALYFGLLTLVSDWAAARAEFGRTWPYVVTLVVGFGIQVGLYIYLRFYVRTSRSKAVLAVNCAASTSSIAVCTICCSAYLANLLPALAATGFFSVVGLYQTQLYWIAIVANFGGIALIAWRLRTAYAAAHRNDRQP